MLPSTEVALRVVKRYRFGTVSSDRTARIMTSEKIFFYYTAKIVTPENGRNVPESISSTAIDSRWMKRQDKPVNIPGCLFTGNHSPEVIMVSAFSQNRNNPLAQSFKREIEVIDRSCVYIRIPRNMFLTYQMFAKNHQAYTIIWKNRDFLDRLGNRLS